MKQTEVHMGEMQHNLAQQRADIQQVNANVKDSLKSIQRDLCSEMAEGFRNQMTDLTALIEKRQRREHN